MAMCMCDNDTVPETKCNLTLGREQFLRVLFLCLSRY
jgi:hypothetical protein